VRLETVFLTFSLFFFTGETFDGFDNEIALQEENFLRFFLCQLETWNECESRANDKVKSEKKKEGFNVQALFVPFWRVKLLRLEAHIHLFIQSTKGDMMSSILLLFAFSFLFFSLPIALEAL